MTMKRKTVCLIHDPESLTVVTVKRDSTSAISNVSIQLWVTFLRRDGGLQEVHRILSTL
jgi:hypothetical protein